MKREHFVVADVYRHLAPFVDAAKPIFLSLDGVAASKGVREGVLIDADVPDLYCTLIDGRQLAIEMKIAYGWTVGAGSGQYKSWFNSGTGAHKPTGWVVADEGLKNFYYWPHSAMALRRVGPPKKSEDRYVTIPLPDDKTAFPSTALLALHILRVA